MGMKVSKDARTPEEFREFAERMSKYFDLTGARANNTGIQAFVRARGSLEGCFQLLTVIGVGIRLRAELRVKEYISYVETNTSS
jgi:hypothetical protein